VRKPADLRAHLIAALPELKRDAERLLLFVDGGALVSTAAPGRAFEYRYTLNVIATDVASDPDLLMAALVAWLHLNEPALEANPAYREQVRFEVDVLANDKFDVSIKVPLTERVLVTSNPDGTLSATNPPEPDLAYEWMPI
jgi:hypothetical protein